MSESKLIRWLLSFIRPLKGKVFLAVFLGSISNLAVVAIPMIGAYEALKIYTGEESHVLWSLLVMLICGIVRGIARYSEQYLNHDIAFRLVALIREQIFSILLKLGPARLIEKRSGDLVTTITKDVEALEVFFAHTISPVLIALVTTSVTVGFLWQFSIILALLLLIGHLFVGVLVPIVSYQQNKSIGDAYQEAFVCLNQTVMEDVSSLQDIVQYRLEEERIKDLTHAGQQINEQYHKRLKQEGTIKLLGEGILLTTAVTIAIIGIQMNMPSKFVLIGTVIGLSSFGPVLALNGLGSTLLTTLASGRRLFRLTKERSEVDFSISTKQMDSFEMCDLSEVSFSYGNETKNVLSELSLMIEKGQTIGIGGESGNGKSTIVKLLMRYWNPQSGKINFDQFDLKDIKEESLHQLEGVMEQTTFIFADTIANNIGLGKKGATQKEIEASAEKAALSEWIDSLPEKYETRIGGNYRSVSDGERQRFGLARLFLQDAPFLLLDEPTSNLDYLNEQLILQTLTLGIDKKTVLLISHRETTLQITDKNYELIQGQLLEKND